MPVHVIVGVLLGCLQIQIGTVMRLIFKEVNRLTAIKINISIIRLFTK